ncbi:MAG: hypothetical protein ACM31C_14330, partial [Acidobacteriota bacterium]
MTARVPAATTSAANALRADEVERTRAFLRTGWPVALGVAAAVVIAPGDPRLARALLVLIAACIAGGAWL